ncbi:MAG: SAM-dependent methyltransferase [Methanofastidiosum sp.]
MNRRIEHKTSRTAEMTCMSRAASYFEKNSLYKSEDFIAPILLPKYMSPIVRFPLTRSFLMNRLAPKGMYEYVIARTKYIDEVFRNAMNDNFDQILIFGAGFDSRGIRFTADKSKIKIFELDAPPTQRAKIKQYKNRKIEIPNNLIFIPIDFEKETLVQKLSDAGFKKGKRSLFILEGLLMYLQENSVDETFKIIGEYAGKGSIIVFDYVHLSVLKNSKEFYGQKEILKMVSDANEMWTFGLEEYKINDFLNRYDFKLKENNDSKKLENKYFKDFSGAIASKINETHCIAMAEKI